jgi:hypothetical protein
VKRLGIFLCCCLPCFLFPTAIAALAQVYGPLSEPGMDIPWSEHAIDSIFWADVCFTTLFIWKMRDAWRWLAAVVSVPTLCVTAVLTIFGGMWVSGDYL